MRKNLCSGSSKDRQKHGPCWQKTLSPKKRPHREKNIQPYRNILKKNENTVSFLKSYDAYIDNIMETFLMGQFMDNGPLTGAYLLGYHCQRAFIYKTKEEKNAELAK